MMPRPCTVVWARMVLQSADGVMRARVAGFVLVGGILPAVVLGHPWPLRREIGGSERVAHGHAAPGEVVMHVLGQEQAASPLGCNRHYDGIPQGELVGACYVHDLHQNGGGGVRDGVGVLPPKHCRSGLGGWPPGLAGQNRAQLAQGLSWRHDLFFSRALQDAACETLALLSVDLFGIDQAIAVERDPDGQHSYRSSRDQHPMSVAGCEPRCSNKAARALFRPSAASVHGTIRATGLPWTVTRNGRLTRTSQTIFEKLRFAFQADTGWSTVHVM